ncbi:hypothetical protein HZY91_10705 [Facklamia sp. DSM 111018]|uniref:IrrE N-terminal-like domain-containing protein n=1 Tax=Facklamia lactis TaxID=2749967 RepID=A0ABS0LT51_9LACT|nr:hypothetical protein [Facklamia lactis]MBG9987335.1 hypothetical protein [Facklamia lactis]
MALKRNKMHSIQEEKESVALLKSLGHIVSSFYEIELNSEEIVDFPISLPNIKIEVSLEENILIQNIKLNKQLLKYKFDYLTWRKKHNFQSLNLEPSFCNMRYQNPNNEIDISIFINEQNRLENNSIYYLILDKIIYTIKHNIKYPSKSIDGYKCIHCPMINQSYILINEIDNQYHLFYLLHEIGHVIVNFLMVETSIIFSIEEEEYWAHYFECTLINTFYKKEAKKYEYFLYSLLEENKAITNYQIELFKYPEKYEKYENKMELYKRNVVEYNLTDEDSINYNYVFEFIDAPFYSASYIMGQENAINHILKDTLIEGVLKFTSIFDK